MTCPRCHAAVPEGDRFCEECGASLSTAPEACAKCGAGPDDIDAEGFCTACGFRRVPPARDHIEITISERFAGVSDRGIRHHRNEDFLALGESGDCRVIVVCDGVSSTAEADQASQAAAEAVYRALADRPDALAEAVGKGQQAVAAIEGDAATTLVAAVVRGNRAEFACVGDSRAYWVDRENPRQLTTDNSWLNEIVAAGEMTAEAAAQSGQSHAITHWLGADAAPEECAPSLVSFEIPGPGWLLLCSDGLWNYAPEAAALAEFINPGEKSALEIARSLIDFANKQGGQDNITAVLLAL